MYVGWGGTDLSQGETDLTVLRSGQHLHAQGSYLVETRTAGAHQAHTKPRVAACGRAARQVSNKGCSFLTLGSVSAT